MPVQHERRRFSTLAACPDSVDDLVRLGNVVPDLHASVAIAIATDQRSCVWQYPSGLRQRECTETQAKVVGNVWLLPG
jgi:hypothetical protein